MISGMEVSGDSRCSNILIDCLQKELKDYEHAECIPALMRISMGCYIRQSGEEENTSP
jgi:hypothetical protein